MGLKILLDTNAVIALLQNNEALHHIASKSSEVYISIISELEFKAFSNISAKVN
jgi:predicted nucleic acid-binding protein